MTDAILETFPLLELPYVAQKEFFHQLELTDVLAFSFISHRCAALVKDANIKIGPLDIKIEAVTHFILVWKRFTPGNCQLEFKPLVPYYFGNYIHHPRMRIVVDSNEFGAVGFLSRNKRINLVHQNFGDIFYSFVQHMRFLFEDVSVNLMELHCNSLHHKFGLYKLFSSFVDFTLSGKFIDDKTLINHLTKCKITGRLQIDGNSEALERTFKLWCNLDHLVIRSKAEWFNRRHLKRVTCRVFSVHDANVSSADIRQYMDSWMEGTERRVESITLTRRDIDAFTLCNDLTYPWRLLGREGSPVNKNDQTPRQLKMTRETDGSQMTVTVKPRCVVMNFQYKSQ